jgi:hypothetical protein
MFAETAKKSLEPVPGSPVKVLFIAGFGRSGSTILGNVLGELDGFFHTGELNFVWEHNLLNDRLCGCGKPFAECEVWGGVLEKAFGGAEGVDAREMIRLQDLGTRTRHAPLMLFPRGRRLLEARTEGYSQHLLRLYRAIRDETGSRVVVDSSKHPSYGYLLGMTPGVGLYVLHLVRDPRAAAFSWLRKKVQPDKKDLAYLPEIGTVKSAAIWDAWNVATEALWCRPPGHYLRLRYEDFVRDPQGSVRRVLNMLGEEEEEVALAPFVGERTVRLGVGHTVSGNPNRFRTGDVEIHPDQEWAEKMRPRDRRVVTVLTLPLLARYGYLSGKKGE